MQLLGMIAIVLGSMGVAFFLVCEEDAKASRIGALLEFSAFIRDSVNNYSMSASDILKTCDRELLKRCGYNFDANSEITLKMLEEECEISDAESERAFKNMIGDFGSLYRQAQVERCDDCISILKERNEYISRQLPSRKRVITCVCFCVATFVLILLL